jgi:hypothetical protein
MVQNTLGMLRVVKKDGEEILFDSINIRTHNINDIVLIEQINQKGNFRHVKYVEQGGQDITLICGMHILWMHLYAVYTKLEHFYTCPS